MTLKKLVVRNFQNHSKKVLKLHPEVTVVTGPSRSGKSALVRALYLLSFNRPRGKSYVSHGSKGCGVRLQLGEDIWASVSKGRRPRYLLGNKAYKATGAKVPEEVAQALNVGSVNFQLQDEPHLWLFDSPGQVAKHLNEIADLETMDRVMAEIAKRVRRLKAEVGVSKSRLKEAKDEYRRLAWVPAMLADLERLERSESRLVAIRARIAQNRLTVRDGIRNRSKADRLSGAIVARLAPLRAGRSAVKLAKRAARLSELVEQGRKYDGVEVPDLSPVVAARTKADEFAERRRRLESLIEETKEKERLWQRLREGQKGTSTQDLSHMRTSRCPVCGRKWPSSPSRTCTSPTSHRRPVQRRVKTGTEL